MRLNTIDDMRSWFTGACSSNHILDDVKEEAIKWLKAKYHPDKTTIEIKHWLEFFNIDDDDLLENEGETKT